MRAVVVDAPGARPRLTELPDPRPGAGQVPLRVLACALCRTDLHILDGEVPARFPLVLGHQVVAERLDTGGRVGVPWLGFTDGTCRHCRAGRENLCDRARFTGADRDGGYAELMVADEAFCLPLPDGFGALDAAPLLCAGIIGYRTLRLAGDPARVGIYGFGSAAHIVAQVAVHEGRRVFALTRPGDLAGQRFARLLGAEWAGGSDETPPEELDAALIFAPVGELVPSALAAVGKGGTVVCGGIHMTAVPPLPYRRLGGEHVLRSATNLTRADGHDLLALAARIPIRTHVKAYALEDAAAALDDLRGGRLQGSAVLAVAEEGRRG